MTTKHKVKLKSFLLFSFFFLKTFSDLSAASSEQKWVIGAERFRYESHSGEDEAVVKGISEMFPNRIMEKLHDDLDHIVYPDEKLDETLYDLRKERLSLFVQLKAEYKKRDSLILNNYSKNKLKSKIREEDKTIKEIQEKIAQNLKDSDDAVQKSFREEKLVKKGMFNQDDLSAVKSFEYMMRNMFSKDSEFVSSRSVSFYKDDQTAFFEASQDAVKAGYHSFAYEKEVVAAGIKSLITGSVTNYGEYYFVNVDLYEYPGGKINASVSEVGLIEDADFISASLAHQLVVALTNGMPVEISFSIEPESISSKVHIYFDDLLQPPGMNHLMTESGVHSIRFYLDGWREIGTSFRFAGDRAYNVSVTMSQDSQVYVNVVNLQPFPGMFYAGGVQAEMEENQEDLSRAKIRINGNQILGQFISQDGYATNYYIPESLLEDGNLVGIQSRDYDLNNYIDKRRRIMYGSYTLLMLSMVPYFYTYGNYYNAANKFNSGLGSYDESLTWQTRNQICGGIAIGCGALFIYELVRYFMAVNSVLPVKAKTVSPKVLEQKKKQALKFQEKEREKKAFEESQAEKAAEALENSESIENSEKSEEKQEKNIEKTGDRE